MWKVRYADLLKKLAAGDVDDKGEKIPKQKRKKGTVTVVDVLHG